MQNKLLAVARAPCAAAAAMTQACLPLAHPVVPAKTLAASIALT